MGAIDGTHITIRNPKDGGSFHYYHKHTDSIPNSDIFLYVSLCDDAFALKKFMLKPYPNKTWQLRTWCITIGTAKHDAYQKTCFATELTGGEFALLE